MTMTLLKKIGNSDIPVSTYQGNELDDEGLDVFERQLNWLKENFL